MKEKRNHTAVNSPTRPPRSPKHSPGNVILIAKISDAEVDEILGLLTRDNRTLKQ